MQAVPPRGGAGSYLLKPWIGAALRPTQGRYAVEAGTGRLLAPGGRYEHMPLRPAHIETTDVKQLAAATRALGAPHPGEWVEAALEAAVDKAVTKERGSQIVMRLAQLAGLLDLADTAETDMLRVRLAVADPSPRSSWPSARTSDFPGCGRTGCATPTPPACAREAPMPPRFRRS
ncbi:hypothetical protein ACSDR0_41320 [Streptosporangium sp. G11]|uniref:hypothetical protein n=1 Tax=Streptosporangium sp. G11 TaxID=3436926 RepID=UPI003EBDBF12